MPKSTKAAVYCYLKDEEKAHYLIRGFLKTEFRGFTFSDPKSFIEAIRYEEPDLYILEDPPLELLLSLWDVITLKPVPYISLGKPAFETFKKAGFYLERDECILWPWNRYEVIDLARKQLYKNPCNQANYYKGVSITKGKEQRCYVNGDEVSLTETPRRLLAYFLNNPKQLVTKKKAQSIIFGDVYIPESRDVDHHISELRKTIPQLKDNLVTIRGKGYYLR
jgi:DNA-binding response OmpR family regulator